jgi:zinc transporter 9
MLLLKGLHQASQTPDRRYQYGYGKASFFWALVSALGMFWTGAGVSCGHGLYTLMHPPELFDLSREMLGVLFVSFLVDGFVLTKTLKEVAASKPPGISMVTHFMNIRDPFVLAVLFEDAAACTGVAFAGTGIVLSQFYHDVGYDTLAGISVGLLLAGVAVKLVEINHRFLLGQAVDEDIVADIRNMLRNRAAISAVKDVQSQWIGPSAFAFKAECDFNGYAMAKRLEDVYVPLFVDAISRRNGGTPNEKDKHDLETVMAWMAEDVTRLIEQEVKEVETLIRQKHPMAAFIELEPDSKKSFVRAYDGKAWRETDTTAMMSRDPSSNNFRLQRAQSGLVDNERSVNHEAQSLNREQSNVASVDAEKADAARKVTTLLREAVEETLRKKNNQS